MSIILHCPLLSNNAILPYMLKSTILVVDDEKSVRESLKILLEDDYHIILAQDGPEALEKFQKENIDLVLLDIRMPGMSGLEVLAELEKLDPLVEVIMVTATTAVDVAVESIHKGARNYITKPFGINELVSMIRKSLRNRARRQAQLQYGNQPFIPPLLDIPSMARVQATLQTIYAHRKPVILEGNSGTEKEAIAFLIHVHSQQRRFSTIHCCQQNEFQSQLLKLEEDILQYAQDEFSVEVGQIQPGVTIFFNRIDNLGDAGQDALLRYFQEKTKDLPDFFDHIRVISSVEDDLMTKIRQGKFSEELSHYLSGEHLFIPSLAERQTDCSKIIRYYIESFNKQKGKTVSFDAAVMQLLCHYDWPGNTVEMVNLLQRLVLVHDRDPVRLESLPLYLLVNAGGTAQKKDHISLDRFLRQFEISYTNKVLRRFGSISTAARKLGISEKELEKIRG